MAKLPPLKFSIFNLHIILTIMLCSCIPSQIQLTTLEDDVLSLQALKQAVDPNTISPSSFLNSWDFTFDPCENNGSQFLGILCNLPLDSSPHRVIALVLDNSGYEGFLSYAIGNLTELTILNLGKNSFRGQFQIPLSV